MTIITRFPPSPTGSMHIGNARTALYNWLFARNKGGKFVLRIEDTDKARSTQEAVEVIFDSLKWLGLDHDNADIVYQSKNLERHTQIAEQLLEDGKAYHCYCTPEELTQMRETARAEGLPPVYDRTWRDQSPDKAPEDIKPVLRIKAPIEGTTTINDAVQGTIEVANTQLDDFIILRSDGSPTYMLSVVVDDHDMGITHILRGQDHLNNASRQKIIYDALGWDVPIMGHMPLITGPDGAKYSKRHGAVGVLDFKNMGILPEALRNYLLRLGWSHGDEEIIPTDKAIEWFNLEHINTSPAKFDVVKLESLNAHYINECDNDTLLDLTEPFYQCTPSDIGRARTLQSMDELKSRAKTLLQLAEESAFYHKTLPLEYDEKAQSLITEGQDILSALLTALQELETFDVDAIKATCKSIAKDHADGKMGKIGMPLRAALTGTTVSPSIFDAVAILGKEETLARLNAALQA